MLTLPLSVACHAEPLKRRFVIDLEQGAGFPNRSYSTSHDQHRSSVNPSVIAGANGYPESEFPAYYKRQRHYSYRVKTTLIESISWQLLYAANLLVAFELYLTSKDIRFRTTPYSSLPIEEIVAVCWLFKSYWNPDSMLFNPMKQQELRQDEPFTISTMTGSGHDQQQGQLSESSGQQTSQDTRQTTSSSTSTRYSCSGQGNGNGDSQQHSHTLGLVCFVHPCRGVCKFRSSPDDEHSMRTGGAYTATDGPNHDDAPMLGNLPATADDLIIINGLLILRGHGLHRGNRISSTITHSPSLIEASEIQQATTGSSRSGQSPPRHSRTVTVQDLPDHKNRVHSGQPTCDETVVEENGQQRPCGRLCKNVRALSQHKRRIHSGQKTCNMTVIGEDGQQRPCAKVCNNFKALLNHKSSHHTGQKTCQLPLVGKDSQQRSCGKLCRSARALSDHKSKYHSGQKTCDMNLIGKDGQPEPCWAVCRNTRALIAHRNRFHRVQETCDVTVVGENNQPQPCGAGFENARALSNHKISFHSRQLICDVTVVRKDGKQRPCGMACKNAKGLSNHKRAHRKRKPVDVDQD
ncbi:hypothetical protein [Endozoicomonas sp. 8E]|uniref:hypothetical protein n=1 Tax=Endozoicomonas sp. 8E TaxID=3035692 RepID=UPI0029391EFA|nr:hypothetical protein [Endozoicomonas sp. 8E]WOG26994.1 hypothetical protein P6910_20950 [Endozoicomonas sp. 8E]